MNLETINGTKRITGTADDKARRVLNTSHRQANITAEEIEAGVTSERLDTIGVPVFRYQTCFTIHGELPDVKDWKRIGGYKAISQNKNGTIGVRYIAIDAEKKKLITERNYYGVKKYHTVKRSDSYTLYKCFGEYNAENLEAGKAELSKVPTNFTGTAELAAERSPYSGQVRIWLSIELGAIPAEAVDGFSEFVCGLTLAEIAEKKRADLEKRAKDERQREADRLAHRARVEAVAEEIKRTHRLTGFTGNGLYIRYSVSNEYTTAERKLEIRKHGKSYKVSDPARNIGKIIEGETVENWRLEKVAG